MMSKVVDENQFNHIDKVFEIILDFYFTRKGDL